MNKKGMETTTFVGAVIMLTLVLIIGFAFIKPQSAQANTIGELADCSNGVQPGTCVTDVGDCSGVALPDGANGCNDGTRCCITEEILK